MNSTHPQRVDMPVPKRRSPWRLALAIPLGVVCLAAMAWANWFVWRLLYTGSEPGSGDAFLALLFVEPLFAGLILLAGGGAVCAIWMGLDLWLSRPSRALSGVKRTVRPQTPWVVASGLVSLLQACAWIGFVMAFSRNHPPGAEPLRDLLWYWAVFPILGIVGGVLTLIVWIGMRLSPHR